MRAILVTCPHCGARVHVAGLSDEIRCEYCGTSSRVQRRTRMFQTVLPPPPAAPHRPIQIAIQRRSSLAVVIILCAVFIPLILTAGIIIFVFAAVKHGMSQATATHGEPARAASARSTGDTDGLEWQGTDGALFGDANGDGAIDLIGRARTRSADEVRVVALDGKTGKKMWQSDKFGSLSETSQARLALAGDLVVFSSQRGEVTALKLATGEKLWSRRLDERTDMLCDGGPSTIVALGVDGTERPMRRSDGTDPGTGGTLGDSLAKAMDKKSPAATKMNKKLQCVRFPTDEEIRVRRASSRGQDNYELGRQHGLSVHPGEAVAEGPGGRVLYGQREKGTRIPMMVGLDDKNGARWKIAVPTDPLGVLAHRPLAVSVGATEVCASYHDDSVAKPPHVACFALADGNRRWDEVAGDRLRTLHVEGGNLYLFASGAVVVRDTATGKSRWTYP